MEPCIPIAEGIYQVQIPLPFALRIVNCYLLHDDDGWTIVDSGLNRAESQAAWLAAFDALDIAPGAIKQIVLTHFHPDHYGLAGWLQTWSGAAPPVLMAPREAELAALVWGLADDQPEPMVALFTIHGAPAELTAAMAGEVRRLRQMTRPHPQVTLLAPGSTLRMGGRDFLALHAPGHSDGQLVFYAAADRLILSGDQVLVKITPHIGMWPESEPDPLGRYLASLRELAGLDVRLGLPGHGPLIRDWAGRLAELEHHHAERLDLMRAAAAGGASGYAVARQVFPFDRLTTHEMRFAVAETVAHLEFLVTRGGLRRRQEAGVRVYAV